MRESSLSTQRKTAASEQRKKQARDAAKLAGAEKVRRVGQGVLPKLNTN